MRKHIVIACLTAGVLLLGPRLPGDRTQLVPPHASDAMMDAVIPAPATLSAETKATPSPAPLPQGIVAIWHGRLDMPLRELAPALSPPRDFTPPVFISVPVSARERVRVRLSRFDLTGPEAGVFTGETADRPGGTVVLSYVGASQAGVIYLPEEGRSFVLSGGDDGQVRITETDLANAPGCPAEPLVPPIARL